MSIKKWYKHQQFIPRWYSVFIHPYYFIRKSLYSLIKLSANEIDGESLLDFGCGSKPYRDLFNVTEYIGIDILNEAHTHENEAIDVFFDGVNIPFEDNRFDIFLASEVLEHVFEPETVVKELFRVLKPNGKGIISTPFLWNEHEIPYDYARYTKYGISHLFKKHGFEVSKCTLSNGFLEAWLQLGIVYIYQSFQTKNKYLNILITMLLISPINIFSLILISLFPKRSDMYNNVVLIVKKPEL